MISRTVEGHDWIRLPDSAWTDDRRYLGVPKGLDGIACVVWVRDALITRHDCILPMASTSTATPAFSAPSPDSLALWQEIGPTLTEGWAQASLEAIEQTVSPDISHHVAYDNHEYTLEGIREYMSVMGYGEIVELAPPLALPAPAGEHRWAAFGSIGGGSLCTFWERDGLIVRHDCVVPIATVPRSIAEPISGD